MQFCLAHPVHGYYMKGDPFGVSGDFITSPEITQVFGEVLFIAGWNASVDMSKGSSSPSGLFLHFNPRFTTAPRDRTCALSS